MNNLINLFQPKVFTIDLANHILPSIINITEKTSVKVKQLVSKMESNRANIKEIEGLINVEVEIWQRKMRALGVDPKGLWTVDFDSGNGLLCWKYPERSVNHFIAILKE